MFDICYICLRSDIKLNSLDEQLENLYDDLSNYDGATLVQFCSECKQQLKKIYNFKKRCQLAIDTLKTWKKKKARDRSVKLLYKKLPQTLLSLCNVNNFKVYYYHTEGDPTPIQISTTHPHIISLNITPDQYNIYKEIKIENINDDDKSFENIGDEPEQKVFSAFLSVNSHNSIENGDEQNDEISLKNERIDDDDENLESFKSLKQNEDFTESDSDTSSIVLSKLIKKKVKKRVVKKKVFSKEGLMELIRKKYEYFGEIKDDEGNGIKMENVLNSLDNMSEKLLIHIGNVCAGSGPFKPLAIRKLSELHKKFAKYESVFTKTYLNNPTQVLQEFENRRSYIEYTNTEHRCETCIRGYKHAKSLEYHNRMYHIESAGTYMCTYCQMRFKRNRILKQHEVLHSIIYKCKLCYYVTNHRSAMMRHYDLHNGIKYTCEYCSKQFRAQSVLYAHYNKMHDSRYICEFCANPFNKEKGLLTHKHLKHAGEEFITSEENKKCEACNIIFINNDIYTKHNHITHNVKEKRNRSKRNTIPKYLCRLCKAEGRHSSWLVGHFAAKHPTEDLESVYGDTKKYLCHQCGKKYSNITALNDHKNTHTGVQPYSCDTCQKKFYRKQTLMKHVERHLPPSKECKHCGKMFVTTSYLASHMRIHINDRRYKCEICGKGFLYAATLKEHVNGVHYNIKRKRKHSQ